MKLARFRWRRLGAALALGLLLETLLLAAMIAAVNTLPHQLSGPIGDLLQAPASYLIPLLAKIQPPGFEEQVGYVLLIPVMQWFVFSVVIYVWLAMSHKKRGHFALPDEEIPNVSGR